MFFGLFWRKVLVSWILFRELNLLHFRLDYMQILILECFLAFFGEKFLFHIFYFENWIYFILHWIICKLCFFKYFLAFFGDRFLFHESYFDNWICFILNWIICKLWFSSVFEPFLEKSFCFMNFISRIDLASFWTGLYLT